MKRFDTVDEYIANADQWQTELIRLREILQSTPLEETVKWCGPCYTHQGKNVVSMGAFKSYVGLWFYQGALLEGKILPLITAGVGLNDQYRSS